MKSKSLVQNRHKKLWRWKISGNSSLKISKEEIPLNSCCWLVIMEEIRIRAETSFYCQYRRAVFVHQLNSANLSEVALSLLSFNRVHCSESIGLQQRTRRALNCRASHKPFLLFITNQKPVTLYRKTECRTFLWSFSVILHNKWNSLKEIYVACGFGLHISDPVRN